jgi:hypothetical protein
VILFTAVIGHATPASAPQTERPGCSVDNPIELPKDLSGLSLKVPRVRVVHSTGARLAGGSMYLQQVDPWLGSALGRSLFQRSFRDRDGVSGEIKREGRIEERFTVAGRDTGVERWNCERLFQTPGQIEGPVTGPLGERVTSFALTNSAGRIRPRPTPAEKQRWRRVPGRERPRPSPHGIPRWRPLTRPARLDRQTGSCHIRADSGRGRA